MKPSPIQAVGLTTAILFLAGGLYPAEAAATVRLSVRLMAWLQPQSPDLWRIVQWLVVLGIFAVALATAAAVLVTIRQAASTRKAR